MQRRKSLLCKDRACPAGRPYIRRIPEHAGREPLAFGGFCFADTLLQALVSAVTFALKLFLAFTFFVSHDSLLVAYRFANSKNYPAKQLL